MPTNIQLILDLDDVLWNTTLYKQNLREKLQRQLGKDYIQNHYAAFKKNYGYVDIVKICNLAARDADLDPKIFIDAYLRQNFRKYLFPDTYSFLKFLNQSQIPYLIVTEGGAPFQKAKYQGLGLNKFVPPEKFKIYQRKLPRLIKLVKETPANTESYLVDDKVKQILLPVKEAVPQIHALWIRQGSAGQETLSEKEQNEVGEFTNLTRIQEYLKALLLGKNKVASSINQHSIDKNQ